MLFIPRGPSIQETQRIARAADLHVYFPAQGALHGSVRALQKNLLRWVKAGEKITLGSDAGGVPIFLHGENAQALEYMGRLGIAPLDAIIAATRRSVECLRLSDRLGTLEPGKEADVLVVEGNPLRDIRILAKTEKIRGVLKGGRKAVWRLPPQ